nr:IS256 family transposase [Pseudonocardia sp. HH130630-07]
MNEQLIARLASRAHAGGLKLTDDGGVLAKLTKRLIESVLDGEITDHLGYDRHDAAEHGGGNSRNGHRSNTVPTKVGPVEIDVPRDRDGSFTPKIVGKRKLRLSGVDDLVISLGAKGLTTGEVAAHFGEIYGAKVSRKTVSKITEKVVDDMAEWQNRPLDAGLRPVDPVIFIDAINVKIRGGKVANRPIYFALTVNTDGHRDILGWWAGDASAGSEGAKYWLNEIKNRGVNDVLMLVCDGLSGPPDAVSVTWPQTVMQTYVVHLLRNSFRYAGRQHCAAIAKALRPIYTAPTEAAATGRFLEFAEAWGERYPAIVQLWENAWVESVPFLSFDAETRKIVCTNNAIEGANARIRRAGKVCRNFPNKAAALKCVYIAIMNLDLTGHGRRRWAIRWKPPSTRATGACPPAVSRSRPTGYTVNSTVPLARSTVAFSGSDGPRREECYVVTRRSYRGGGSRQGVPQAGGA